jgi:hypothetical protein
MEPRDRVIRVRTSTYNKLAELGNILEDYDDVITRLLEEHDEQEERRSKKEISGVSDNPGFEEKLW